MREKGGSLKTFCVEKMQRSRILFLNLVAAIDFVKKPAQPLGRHVRLDVFFVDGCPGALDRALAQVRAEDLDGISARSSPRYSTREIACE